MRKKVGLLVLAFGIAGCGPTIKSAPGPPRIYNTDSLPRPPDTPIPESNAPATSAPPQTSSTDPYGFATALPEGELAKRVAAASAYPLGSEQNPVRVFSPLGQQAYLNRLRCDNGQPPTFKRDGNIGRGTFGSIVDLYVVDCGKAAPGRRSIYMDMYHQGAKTGPIEGFSYAIMAVGSDELLLKDGRLIRQPGNIVEPPDPL